MWLRGVAEWRRHGAAPRLPQQAARRMWLQTSAAHAAASSLLVTHTVAASLPALALPVAGFFNKSDLKAKYTVATEQLGSGNFAVVKKATKTAKNTNAAVPQEVAIKFIDKSKVEDMNDIQREIEIMQVSPNPDPDPDH